jgi:excinuclease ABC subunit C
MKRDHTSVQTLPDCPGIYFFVGPKRQVLYVGKATSLHDRVRSYFGRDLVATRGAHMVRMVDEAVKVECKVTDSVLEALILEAHLIKELKPPFNTRDKDDKSFLYVVITKNEVYPRVLLIRGKDLPTRLQELTGKTVIDLDAPPLPVFGPFPHALQLKEAMRLIRKIFPFYDTVRPVHELRAKKDARLRFNESIGVYPPSSTTPSEYARTVRHIILFFQGKKQRLLRSLERDMRRYAHHRAFEAAGEVKRQLFALQHINDISLMKREQRRHAGGSAAVRIEGYDIAHLAGTDMVGVMVVLEGGVAQKKEYRTFTIRSVSSSNDTAALREVLTRRLAHPEWRYPDIIVVDGSTAQSNVTRTTLREAGMTTPVVAVTKDEHHRPKRVSGPIKIRTAYANEILLANAEAHRFSLSTHTRKRSKRMRS